MTADVRAVFVFSDDPLPMVFPSLDSAAGYMEAIDVDNGEYHALYTLDGQIVIATTSRDEVVLELTPERDQDDLRERLRQWAKQGDLASDPDDLVAVANELLRQEWENRWPRRPRWLARRLHGDRPTQI